MKSSSWTAAALMLVAATPAHSQGVIQVKVVDGRSNPVPSDIQFRRSAGGEWEMLERADRGTAAISFACAPGVQLRADPINGRYTNSDVLPCGNPLTLRVAERSVGYAFSGGNHAVPLSRGQFAALIARQEREEDGPLTRHGDENSLALPPETEAIRRLNESSELFERLDRNGDERVSNAEAAAGPDR